VRLAAASFRTHESTREGRSVRSVLQEPLLDFADEVHSPCADITVPHVGRDGCQHKAVASAVLKRL
jgi:hypothetical protein